MNHRNKLKFLLLESVAEKVHERLHSVNLQLFEGEMSRMRWKYLLFYKNNHTFFKWFIYNFENIYSSREEMCSAASSQEYNFSQEMSGYTANHNQYKAPPTRVLYWNFNRLMYQISIKFTWHLLLECILMFLNRRNNNLIFLLNQIYIVWHDHAYSHHKLKLKVIMILLYYHHYHHHCYHFLHWSVFLVLFFFSTEICLQNPLRNCCKFLDHTARMKDVLNLLPQLFHLQ